MVLRGGASTDGKLCCCRRRNAQLTPLYGLVRHILHQGPAAGGSHTLLRSLPCSALHSSCCMRTTPIGSENLGLCNEGGRLVLKSLDSRCSGLGLAVTGDAGSLYPFWPGTGNDILYPQGLSTRIIRRISDVRISVLVLDSIVDDVAMM